MAAHAQNRNGKGGVRWPRPNPQIMVIVFLVGVLALWSAISLLFYLEIP